MRTILTIQLVAIFFFGLISQAYAQEPILLQDKVSIVKAKVLEVLSEERRTVPGTDVESVYQSLKVEILEGEKKGMVIELSDDYLHLKAGDVFLLNDTIRAEDKVQLYTVSDSYRLPALAIFALIFIVLVVVIGGIQGVRGLVSLAGSLLLILYVLIPGILEGYSPILMSIAVSSLIIILGSYVTHGFNKTTSSAVIGMIITVIITGALAYWSVNITQLTGFESEEAVYLNLSTRGSIDIVGILLSGIMIGLLGVLYDVAIGQAISVEELHRIAPHVSRRKIYLRALRMGREHIGALVNTLAIAYVGASLPLLLLFSLSETATIGVMNREIFATEIMRTLIGSIGLVLAVPITTLLAVWILVKKKEGHVDEQLVAIEKKALEHVGHKH
jgi:uncharacterized membrane protein